MFYTLHFRTPSTATAKQHAEEEEQEHQVFAGDLLFARWPDLYCEADEHIYFNGSPVPCVSANYVPDDREGWVVIGVAGDHAVSIPEINVWSVMVVNYGKIMLSYHPSQQDTGEQEQTTQKKRDWDIDRTANAITVERKYTCPRKNMGQGNQNGRVPIAYILINNSIGWPAKKHQQDKKREHIQESYYVWYNAEESVFRWNI